VPCPSGPSYAAVDCNELRATAARDLRPQGAVLVPSADNALVAGIAEPGEQSVANYDIAFPMSRWRMARRSMHRIERLRSSRRAVNVGTTFAARARLL
jgi:hypothetical protein